MVSPKRSGDGPVEIVEGAVIETVSADRPHAAAPGRLSYVLEP